MTSDGNLNDNFIDGNEVAKLLNMSIHTVRDYKKRGLFKVADKQGNADLYDKADVIQRQSVIREKRRQGYTLTQIGTMLGKELEEGG